MCWIKKGEGGSCTIFGASLKGGEMSQYHHNFRAQDSHLDPPDEPEIQDDELRVICPSCRHTVEPYERKGADENGVYIWLECPDCYEDITDAEEI